jgi:tetratricopeptide (TPR) repeat protein
LTQSRKGRAVELLQVGQPGIGKQALLLTARHHACEALASYALEGFLQEAISESPAAEEFRKKYVLYAVPFVDKDGVEEGDQGKGRKPHDHNRDYGEAPLYPEIQAIEKLADEKKITFSMDLHCPYIKGDIHEAFHFLGLGVPHVKDNLTEWISWMSEERPPQVMAPLQFLVDPKKPNAVNKSINSHYFATRDGVLLAATLEIPYNQTDLSLNADMLRAYGAAMLQAWNHMAFVATDGGTREGSSYSDLEKWRYQFRSTYRREPDKTAAALQAQIDDPKTTPLYRAEALIGLAKVRAQQKRYADAAASCTAALKVDGVMNSQRAEATILRMQVLAEAPDSATTAFAANLEEALRFPYLSKRQQTQLYEAAVDFHQSRKQYEDAIAAARQQFTVAADYQQGQILNRVAALYELQMQPDKALATRREAVALLKAQIGDKANRSVFGATMVKEYFAAVMAVPTSTLAEKKAAADLVLNHDIVLPADKEKVRKQIEALAAP